MRTHMTLEQALRGESPDPFTPEEWIAMRHASLYLHNEAHYLTSHVQIHKLPDPTFHDARSS